MSTPRLLDRQRRLVELLTDPGAYGSDGKLPEELAGLDRRRLALVGQLSLGKRMDKIAAVLPVTFSVLGGTAGPWAEEFAAAFPPESAARYDNALQFHRFLRAGWERAAPEPPYLPDVARFELALARVKLFAGGAEASPGVPGDGARARRRPEVEMVRCAFDIRPLFDSSTPDAEPARRRIHLVITCPAPGAGPRVFEVDEQQFDLLGSLDHWRRVEEVAALHELARLGMVELAP